ncbi:MAG: hypothetical protein K2X86_06375 [Cytophagaceae bacterium]|nr:hypothetical protein [Cytophagaceae bacterium]
MKKVFLSLGLLIICSVIFYACKKDQVEVPTPISEIVSVQDGRLIFDSKESYENFINDESDNGNARLAFKTAIKGSSDTLIEDDFLAELLNEKNIVQIGSKAYKLDFKEHKVYVLRDVTDANMILLENKDVSSGKLGVYSMDDDVLEEEGEEVNYSATAKKKKCKEGGARRCKDRATLNTEDEISVKVNTDGSIVTTVLKSSFAGKLVYQKAGIYFSIQSKLTWDSEKVITTYPANGGNPSTEYVRKNNQKFHGFANANGVYKVKCKNEYTLTASLPAKCYNKMQLDDESKKGSRLYRGSKALNKYCIDVTYKFNTENCDPSVNAEMIFKIGDGYPGCDVCPNKD